MSIGSLAHHRADLIAWHCFYRRPDGGTFNYPDQRTIVDPVSDEEIKYWVAGKDAPDGKWGAWVHFTKIRAVNPANFTVVDERKQDPHRETTQWQEYTNDSSEIQQFTFSDSFGGVETKQKSFQEGFEEKLSETFGTGDGSPVTASVTSETTLSALATQAFGTEKNWNQTFSRQINVAPKTHVKVQGWREICKMEQDIEGYGDLDMDIEVASWFHHGPFGGRFAWHFCAHFTWQQFLRIVTGEVLPYDFSHEFQENPLPQHPYIDQLKEPLTDAKIKQTLVFDDVQHEDVTVEETSLEV